MEITNHSLLSCVPSVKKSGSKTFTWLVLVQARWPQKFLAEAWVVGLAHYDTLFVPYLLIEYCTVGSQHDVA